MKFSIITPVTMDKEHPDNFRMPRYEMFLRCASSVFGQTFQDFEWVIADDISNPPIEEILEANDSWWTPKGIQVKIVRLPEKLGRISARDAGMAAASGDWVIWLDADDEFALNTLEALNDAIRVYPDYKVFNFNHLCFGYDYHPYIREFIDVEKLEGKPFPSGNIGAGAFLFHKDVYRDIGPIPELGLWQFSKEALKDLPGIRQFFEKKDGQGNFNGQYNTLGNPWGEDYYYFYKMTRKYPSKKLNSAFYYVHSRFGHRWPDDPDYVVDPGKAPSWNPSNK